MLFHFSKAAMEQLKNPELCAENAENRFCEWTCDIFLIGHKKYFMLSNSYSMFSTVFEAKGILSFEKFAQKAKEEIKSLLKKYNYDEILEEHIIPNFEKCFASKSSDKSLTAKMNRQKMYISYLSENGYKDELTEDEMTNRINKDLITNLAGEDYVRAKDVFGWDFMKESVNENAASVPAKKAAKEKVPAAVFQFYVELCNFKPKMWRRFTVKSTSKMTKLAAILLSIYNAQGYHLFDFYSEKYDFIAELPDPDGGNNEMEFYKFQIMQAIARNDLETLKKLKMPPEKKDAKKVKICEMFKEEKDYAVFTYDFGDNWEFKITLEKIIEDSVQTESEILEGKGYGIIEDCGGTGSLENLRKVFAEKSGEEYEECKEWLGRDELDLETFDLNCQNADLNASIKYFEKNFREME